jgi:16S rRNA processing protein RimM
VPVARIAGPFGVRGELKCDPTDAGRTLILAGSSFRCVPGGTTAGAPTRESTIELSAVRPHKGRLLVRIDGVDDADAAERYRDAMLYAPRDQIELEPEEYLDADLTGCEVVDADSGHRYGVVDSVAHYPSNDMLIVGSVMVPMVAEFIRSIDVAARRIVISPPAGLFE